MFGGWGSGGVVQIEGIVEEKVYKNNIFLKVGVGVQVVGDSV